MIGSYAAQFLTSDEILSSLFSTIVFGSVKDVYTYHTDTIDLATLGGSVAAQQGSSGGGVVNADGELVATIVTSTTEGDTSMRQLSAITANYLRRSYASETSTLLELELAKPLTEAVSDFAPEIPTLRALITAQLSH